MKSREEREKGTVYLHGDTRERSIFGDHTLPTRTLGDYKCYEGMKSMEGQNPMKNRVRNRGWTRKSCQVDKTVPEDDGLSWVQNP